MQCKFKHICSIWFYDTRRSHRKYFKIYFSEWKKRLILFKKLLMCKLDNSKKVCLNCHCVTDKRSEKCLACGYTSKNYPSREILYGDRLLSKHFCLQPFCPKDSVFFTVCLVQFPWGNPRVDSKWKVDEIHVTRLPKKCISDTLSDCRSIACTLLMNMIVFSVRIWEYLHSIRFAYIFLSAAAAMFVGILEFYGEFWKVHKKDTYNLPLCVFVGI